MIKISHDIICHWSINLFWRIATYSPELHIPVDQFFLEYFILKFHLPTHSPSCHIVYSFNYHPGVGRTHRENIESGWAHTNLATVMTWEMGPGAWHLALNSHWGGLELAKDYRVRWAPPKLTNALSQTPISRGALTKKPSWGVTNGSTMWENLRGFWAPDRPRDSQRMAGNKA